MVVESPEVLAKLAPALGEAAAKIKFAVVLWGDEGTNGAATTPFPVYRYADFLQAGKTSRQAMEAATGNGEKKGETGPPLSAGAHSCPRVGPVGTRGAASEDSTENTLCCGSVLNPRLYRLHEGLHLVTMPCRKMARLSGLSTTRLYSTTLIPHRCTAARHPMPGL